MITLTDSSKLTKDIVNMGTLQATGIVMEGNNITLNNTADIKNAAGTAILTGSDVTLKAGGIITVGHDVTATIDRTFNINGTDEYKTVHDYANFTVPASGYTAQNLTGTTKTMTECMLVETVYDLQNMNDNLSGNYMLAKDIDASETTTWNKDSDVYTGFYSIGFVNGSNNYFTGTFDGADHAIKGLNVNRPSNRFVGLFGRVKGRVQNVGLEAGSITGDYFVGGVVGYLTLGGSMNNVYNTGTVTSTAKTYDASNGHLSEAGGVVGSINNKGFVSNVYNTGAVTGGGRDVGGVAGALGDGCTITNAYNTGTVTSTGGKYAIGGVLGGDYSGSGTVSHVYNTGNISVNDSNTHWIGGVVGSNAGTVTYAYNTGNIICNGNDQVGGVVGLNTFSAAANIQYAYNTGNISTGGRFVGGVVGSDDRGTVSDVYNTGAVSGNDYVGGICGQSVGAYTRIYNTGAVSGVTNVGGVVGSDYDNNTSSTGNLTGTITNALWANDVSYTPAEGLIKPTQAIGNAVDTANVKGLSGDDMKKAASYDNWTDDSSNKTVATTGNAGKTWRIYEGYTTPLLTGFMNVVTFDDTPAATYNGLAQKPDFSSVIYSPGNIDTGYIYSGSATNVGTYNILYSDQQHYDLVNTNFIINKATLTLNTSGPSDYTYGATAAPVINEDFTGFVNGETLATAAHTGTTVYDTSAIFNTITGKTSNAGTYTYTYTGNVAFDNYNLISNTTGTGTVIIKKAPMTLTANPVTMTYGQAERELTYGYTLGANDLVNGDTTDVLSGIAYTNSAYNVDGTTKGVASTYTVTPSVALTNYEVTPITGTVTMNKAAATIRPTANLTITYGDVASLEGSYIVAPLVNGDTGTADFIGSVVYDTAALKDSIHTKDASDTTYSMTINNVAGLSSNNYSFVIDNSTPGSVTITPAKLTLTADKIVIRGGDPLPVFTGQTSGYMNGDSATEEPDFRLSYTTSHNPGSYGIIGYLGGKSSGLYGTNYYIVQAPGNSTALTITSTMTSADYSREITSLVPRHGNQIVTPFYGTWMDQPAGTVQTPSANISAMISGNQQTGASADQPAGIMVTTPNKQQQLTNGYYIDLDKKKHPLI